MSPGVSSLPSRSTVVAPAGARPTAVMTPSATQTSTSEGSAPEPSATLPPAYHVSVTKPPAQGAEAATSAPFSYPMENYAVAEVNSARSPPWRLLSTFGEDLPPRSATLREIAAQAATSLALLRYHFGSHAGVLAAMLVAQRARDNDTLASGADTASFSELVERIGALYADPGRIARIRSLFLVAGFAAQDPETFTEFIASLNDLTALLTHVAIRDGASEESAALRATVTIAAFRGLLLQEVLATGAPAEPALQLVLQLIPPSEAIATRRLYETIP